MDKGFYALGLLHHWQTSGSDKHWMIPLRKGAQYRVKERLGAGHELVELTPQPRKKWEGAPATLTARLISKKINGRTVQSLANVSEAA